MSDSDIKVNSSAEEMEQKNKKKWNYFFKLKKDSNGIGADPKKRKSFMGKVQLLGKTFILPVSLLAFSGILLGIGSGLTNPSTIEQMPWLGVSGLHEILLFFTAIGSVGFMFLPFLFAMAIPLGLATDNKGIAAMSGFLGFATLLVMMQFMANVLPDSLTNENGYIGKSIVTIVGLKTMDIGVLGAIATGLLVFVLHEKFQYINLPAAIGFWTGRRFVPIVTISVFSILGILLVFIWPAFNLGINWIGQGIEYLGWFGPWVYGFTNVMVRPAGLHHLINAMVRFSAVGGRWIDPTNPDSTEIVGALNIYFAQLQSGAPIDYKVTRFLSGGYMPVAIFGLPAAAIAIWTVADKEEKQTVKAVIIPGIIAMAVGGISEPIEFLFLFVAPLLYVFHAVMIGLGYMVMGLLQLKIGNTDGNVIDFIIFGVIQGLDTKWYYVLVVGPIFAAIYYFIFVWYIKWKDIPVIGREKNLSTINTIENDDNLAIPLVKEKKVKLTGSEKAKAAIVTAESYLSLLGGKSNIDILDNCYSRLRVTLKEHVEISQEQVKALGAIGIKWVDPVTVQIVIGPLVEKVKNDIAKIMREQN